MGLLVVFERERTKFHLAVATEFSVTRVQAKVDRTQ